MKRKKLSIAGMNFFYSLSKQWELDIDQQIVLLGIKNNPNIEDWKKYLYQKKEDLNLADEQLERLSYIASIRKNIEIQFQEERWNYYMKTPNKYFDNQSLLEILLKGNIDDLIAVKEYLESSTVPHFY